MSSRPLLLLLSLPLLALNCNEYDITPKDDVTGGDTGELEEIECDGLDEDADGRVDEDWWGQDADGDGVLDCVDVEECDGEDNDGDMAVDEGFDGDVDADGIPDCQDIEDCDGLDNDADGTVDEGFGDLDGDGITDCTDDACDVTLAPAGSVTIDESCSAPDVVVTDPWNVGIEWQWQGVSTSDKDSYVAPLVANLTDTNGDGAIDTDDTPNVLVMTVAGTLAVLEGDTGNLVWSQGGNNGPAGTAVADIDNDGSPDIISYTSSRQLIAREADGSTKWTSSTNESVSYPLPTVADVDMDGQPEVISNTFMVNGSTGSTVQTFNGHTGIPYFMVAVGDIDLDGDQEIIQGNSVYSPNGTVEWTTSVRGNYGHWPAIVDVDGDPEGEVIFIGAGVIAVHDHDGTLISSTSSSAASRPGPPCVADFDGDGLVEIAWPSNNTFGVFELDGTPVWSAAVNDSSGLAGCAGYDVDGDGVYEAIYADQDTLWIFDGAAGTVRYSQPGHSSVTAFEIPVIADIDNDESAEIVFVSNYWSSFGTVTTLGHNGDGWQKSGSTWPVHDFAVTNVNPDASVPYNHTPPWQVHNVYRARPTADTVSSNLQAFITDVCVSSCDDAVGTMGVAVMLRNTGASEVAADVNVALYSDSAGALTLLDTQVVSGPIPGGTVMPGFDFTIPVTSMGTSGLVVVADDDGTGRSSVAECDEGDNEDTWYEVVCP